MDQRIVSGAQPRVCYCEEEWDLKGGTRSRPLVRDIFIVECCEEGYGSVIINGREFDVGPGCCYILLPGDTVIHTADEADPRKGVWCSLDGADLGHYFAQAGISSENPYAPPELFDELRHWVRRMVSIWRSNSAGTSLLLTSYVYGLLGTLLSASARPAAEEWVGRVIGLMETRYQEELSVSLMAQEIGLERAYFSTLFKKRTGRSPHRYLTELRCRKACSLLRDPALSISEVAAAVGLDPRNFARLFKAETGKSPQEYRK